MQSSGFFQSEEQANLAQQLCTALTQALLKYQQKKQQGIASTSEKNSSILTANFPATPLADAQAPLPPPPLPPAPLPGRFPISASAAAFSTASAAAFSTAFANPSANNPLPIANVKHSYRVPTSSRPAFLDHNAAVTNHFRIPPVSLIRVTYFLKCFSTVFGFFMNRRDKVKYFDHISPPDGLIVGRGGGGGGGR